jgi:adenylate cyclase
MFGTYLSPKLVNQMVDAKEEPKLGGSSQYITCFFTDIEGFSRLSSEMQPADLVELMNTYLDTMTTIIESEGGTLDKYIGDAIIVIFGAPISFPEHALSAIRSAARMQAEQALLREKFKNSPTVPELASNMRTRIGIHTGDAVVGNMGSSKRFNYTMMGDTVNLAARSESGAKSYGVYTFITETTKLEAEKSSDEFLFRFVDKIVVSGRKKAENMFELIDVKKRASNDDFECVSLYEQGMKEYFARNWQAAIALFERSIAFERYQINKESGIQTNPSGLLIARCKEYAKTPPSSDWDGRHIMESK